MEKRIVWNGTKSPLQEVSHGTNGLDSNRVFYPDANFTMRIAYGKVEGYESQDAVSYTSGTTLDGVMEKEVGMLQITGCFRN